MEKDMKKIIASDEMVKVVRENGTPYKILRTIKLVTMACVLLIVLFALSVFSNINASNINDLGNAIAIIMILIIVAGLAVSVLRALAIITEAASIYILEHAEESDSKEEE